ncbi:uncharacterized protein LOC132738666 [Ruditapes philippinarum]|uniref:uncharacterized protein LOC132738666 n=1 Tax=Ruditapes philippinarum TaxID=129788 RepID=UPI00295A7371|nr:uncharacterized protein LOC132738666 [Ruditapes philippinarum]
MSITKLHFQISWNVMEQVMLRLGSGIPNLQNEILTLRDKSIDPAKEKEYQKIIKEWEETDMIIQKHIDEINSKLEKTGEDIDKVKQDLENTNQKSTDVCNTVAFHEKKIETIENKQIEETTRIDQLDDESLQQRTQLSVMESRQKKLEQDMKDTSITLTTMAKSKLHPRLQNLATITELYTEDQDRDNVYVETTAHKNAKEILLKTGCIILIGPPGEGKTTMAAKLLSETSQKGSCLKLTLPTDWDNIDINKGMFDTIFIDDIFGAGTLDENLLNGWSLRCKDMEKALKARMIRLIITSRHYIYFKAKMKVQKCTIFKLENIQPLASFNLTSSERSAIITKHVDNADKVLSTKEIEQCSQTYEKSFTFSRNQYKIPIALSGYLSQKGQIKAMIGFPEIVSLFCHNETLFNLRSYFFSKPNLFFKKCLGEPIWTKNSFLF